MRQTVRTPILRPRARFTLAAATLWCGVPTLAGATVVRALDLEQQVGLSDLVVEGRVDFGQQTIDPVSGRPLTDTPIHIAEVLRGSPVDGGILHVRQIRGHIGDQFVSLVGDPALKAGDHVILLLRRVDGRYYLTALGQSVFWIDDGVSPPRVEQRLDGLVRVSERGGGHVRAADPRVPTLTQLRAAIRAAGAVR